MPILFCLLFLAAPAFASSVSVTIDSINPDPTWLNESTQLHATAIFTKDGPEQQQATLGWHEEYRWKWELTPDGTVTSTAPGDDGTGSGWTVWSEQSTATCNTTFTTPGTKSVQLAVEARMVNADNVPATESFVAQTSTSLEVLHIQDVSDLWIAGRDIGMVMIEWPLPPNPDIKGFKYHIEPYSENLFDVGYTDYAIITGLKPGQQYTIRVHSYDEYGNITRSPSVTFSSAIDTDCDGWWNDVEILQGTDPNDRGSCGTNDTQRFAINHDWGYDGWHAYYIFTDQDVFFEGGSQPANYYLQKPPGFVYYLQLPTLKNSNSCFFTARTFINVQLDYMVPEGWMTMGFDFPKAQIESECASSSNDTLFQPRSEPGSVMTGQVSVGSNSVESVFSKLCADGYKWPSSCDFGDAYDINSWKNYPASIDHGVGWQIDVGFGFSMCACKMDLDMEFANILTSGPSDFQNAPDFIALPDDPPDPDHSARQKIRFTLEGRLPAATSSTLQQTIQMIISDTSVIDIDESTIIPGDYNVSSIGTVGKSVTWTIDWADPPGIFEAELRRGTNPGLKNARITVTAKDITTEHTALCADFMPNDTAPEFVKLTGSFESTEVLGTVDLDVDSDNDALLEQDEHEDGIETNSPGKMLCVNDGDTDKDGINDYEDFDGTGGTENAWAPMILKIPLTVDLSVAQIKFTYLASDPTVSPLPAPGAMRVWTKPQTEVRNPYTDFIEAGTVYSLSAFTPVSPDNPHIFELYLEGIEPAVGTISAEVDPDGAGSTYTYCMDDSVAVTISKVESVEIVGAPSDGLVVKKGKDVTFKATIAPPGITLPAAEPKWYHSRLKADGSWETLASFGPDAHGKEYTYTTGQSGIFRLKCVLTIGGGVSEKLLERTVDDPHSDLKAGDSDAFGVVDTAIQIAVRGTAKGKLGSTYYAKAGALPNWRDPFNLFTGTNKCNVFIADVCDDAGADVDPPTMGVYTSAPPSANNWAGMPDINDPDAPYPIPDWTLLPDNAYPQPGHVTASGFETGASGHCGIVDYDGQWISAGPTNVNRKAQFSSYKRNYVDGTIKPAGQRTYQK